MRLLITLFVCGLVWGWYTGALFPAANTIDDVALSELPRDQVVLFATRTCHVCKKARRFFEQNGIDYVEYDVGSSEFAREQYRKIIQPKGVPLIWYKGDYVLGFSQKKVRALLSRV